MSIKSVLLAIVQICSGISRGSVLNEELNAHIFQKSVCIASYLYNSEPNTTSS